MNTKRIDYAFADRDTTIAQIASMGGKINDEYLIDLDANGVPQTCYCMVADAPPATDSAEALLAEADQQILDLTYQNLILQEGLTQ